MKAFSFPGLLLNPNEDYFNFIFILLVRSNVSCPFILHEGIRPECRYNIFNS